MAIGAALPAQRRILGVVYAPDGKPLAQAEVTFVRDTEPLPIWMRAAETAPTVTRVKTDNHGRFKLPSETRGTVVVMHDSGAGAIVFGCTPDVPERIATRPCSKLTIVSPRGEATVDLAAVSPVGQVALWRSQGNVILLPEGEYRLLLQEGEMMLDTRCRLRSGRIVEVELRQAGRRVPIDSEDKVWLALDGWPPMALTESTGFLIPPNAAAATLLVGKRDQLALHPLWLPDLGAAPFTPPPVQWRLVPIEGALPASCRVWSIATSARGPRVLGVSRPDDTGRTAIVDDCSVVVSHQAGYALDVKERAAAGQGIRLTPSQGLRGLVETLDESPEPLALEFVAAAHPWLKFPLCADRRGAFALAEPPVGGGTVWLRSSNHRATYAEFDPARDDTIRLVADPGALVQGQVVKPDGTPAVGAMVTIRDTSDAAGTVRWLATQDDGRFRFQGLDEEHLYAIAAAAESGPQTWSAQIRGVQPGVADWLLQLRLEDPAPPSQREPSPRRR